MTVEVIVNVYFTLQTILLISVYPTIKLYFSSLTNWIDVISVLPFYLKIIAKEYLNQVSWEVGLSIISIINYDMHVNLCVLGSSIQQFQGQGF